ncbi:MAG: hypothetical protein ACFFCI_09415 [Promethearchaeota archaeon]
MSPLEIMTKKYHCPRCGSTDIVEYESTFDCTHCRDTSGLPLEFKKEFIGKIPDNEILAIQEMGAIFDEFEELKDEDKAKKMFDSLMDDLNDEN